MQFTWSNPYGLIDQFFYNKQNVSNFYRRISKYNLTLSIIR
jgi:hypothetical protein